jgi:hypothetical protein
MRGGWLIGRAATEDPEPQKEDNNRNRETQERQGGGREQARLGYRGQMAVARQRRRGSAGGWCGTVGRAKGPGPRSLDGLRWLARVDVAGLEPWGLAMGFGWRATYSHAERLQAAGLAVRLYDREGSVVAITAAGRRLVRADGGEPRLGATRGLGLRHARAVSWVAALLTVRGRTWVSDRELRDRADWRVPVFWPNSHGTHRPDAGAEVAGRRVAVEVELSHKAPRRLRAILAGYEALIADGALDGGLLYVSDRPDVLRAVTRACARIGIPPTAFKARTLEHVQSELRRAARPRGDAPPNGGRQPDSGVPGPPAIGDRDAVRVAERAGGEAA